MKKMLLVLVLLSFLGKSQTVFAKTDYSADFFQLNTDSILKLARGYNSAGQYDSAIYNLSLVLRIAQKKGELQTLGQAHSIMGLSYSSLREFKLAKKHLDQARALIDKNKDPAAYSKVLANLGNLHSKFNQHSKALTYFKSGIQLIPLGEKMSYEIALSNIGACFVELDQLDSAIVYINKALVLSQEIEDKLGELICVNNLATIYRNQKKNKLSLKYYLKALSMVDSVGSKENKKEILLNVSEAYEQLGDFKKSLSYYTAYTNLKDELFNKEKSEFILELEQKYDASVRDKEIAELKIKKQQDATEKLLLRYTIWIGIVVFVLIIVVSLGLYRSKMQAMKNERKFAIITATVDSEEKERLRISQEIHDDLGGVLGMSRMLFSRAKGLFLEKDQELYKRIDHLLVSANERSRQISHELFSPTLKQFGLIKALEELIEYGRVAKPQIRIQNYAKGNEIKIDEQVALNLYRISQELLNNSFKYAEAGEIKLFINATSTQISLIYRDNGKGVDLVQAKRGVGMKSIQSRVSRIRGKVEFISSPQKGFCARMVIPST